MKSVILLMLVAVFIVVTSIAASAGMFKGKPISYWVETAQSYGFTSERALDFVANDLPNNPKAISAMDLLVETNQNTLQRKKAVGDTNLMLAYSKDPIVSGFIETLVDFYPDLGIFPKVE